MQPTNPSDRYNVTIPDKRVAKSSEENVYSKFKRPPLPFQVVDSPPSFNSDTLFVPTGTTAPPEEPSGERLAAQLHGKPVAGTINITNEAHLKNLMFNKFECPVDYGMSHTSLVHSFASTVVYRILFVSKSIQQEGKCRMCTIQN
jgi:hypothetical protein